MFGITLARTYMNMSRFMCARVNAEQCSCSSKEREWERERERAITHEFSDHTVNQSVHINGVFAVNFYACAYWMLLWCLCKHTHCVAKVCHMTWFCYELHYKLMSVIVSAMMNDASLVSLLSLPLPIPKMARYHSFNLISFFISSNRAHAFASYTYNTKQAISLLSHSLSSPHKKNFWNLLSNMR